MFPCLPISGNIVPETKFASQEAKMFPNKIRNIFVAETMFSSLPTCFQMFPARETLGPFIQEKISRVLRRLPTLLIKSKNT